MKTDILYIEEHCGLDCGAFIEDLLTVLRVKNYLTAVELNAAQAQALLYQYSFGTLKKFKLSVSSLRKFLIKSNSPFTFKHRLDSTNKWGYCLKLK